MVDQQRERQSRSNRRLHLRALYGALDGIFQFWRDLKGTLASAARLDIWVALLKRAILDTEKEGKGGEMEMGWCKLMPREID